MKVIIWGDSKDSQTLEDKIAIVLDELGLKDFIQVEKSLDNALKQELSISEDSALIIEEESIDFKDMIFEGLIPDNEELKSMFISIIGGGSGGGCGSKDDDGSCGTGCSTGC